MILCYKTTITALMILYSVTLADIPDGPYFGQELPGSKPELFAPGVVPLVSDKTWGGTFSPEGDEFFFTVADDPGYSWSRIIMTKMDSDGHWSTPTVAPFSGVHIDWVVQFAPDGNRLFFSSGRPPGNGWALLYIFMIDRIGEGWSEPTRLDFNVTTIMNAAPCAKNGTLYFRSTQANPGLGIYRAVVEEDGQYQTHEPFDITINAQYNPGIPCIAPDESYILFSSNHQTGILWEEDLYICFRKPDNTWTSPRMLGPHINTPGPGREWLPRVSAKGDILFFLRGDVEGFYWVSTKAFLPDPNGPIENLSSGQRFSSLNCAISYADEGDSIVIGPDLYQESIFLNDKHITLRSVDPNDPFYIGSTIIQGDLNNPVVTLSNNTTSCVLAGLTLRAGSIGISGTGTNATIRNCRMIDNAEHGMVLSQESNPHLLHCLITGNGQTGITMIANTGGRTVTFCKPTIEDCIIVDNGGLTLEGGEPEVIDSIIQ